MDKYTLETDGSYFEPMGICGIGGVLYKNGEMIDCYSLTSRTNPQDHESLSILYGLLLAKKYDVQDLTIKTDSQSHVVVLKSKSVRRQEKDDYIGKSLRLIQSFDKFKIKYQQRESNRTADKLSTLYKHNNYASVSDPIDVSGVLDNVFLNNQTQAKLSSYQVLMFDISNNITEKAHKLAYLNTIEYDGKINKLNIKAQATLNQLDIIAEQMMEQIQNKKCPLIFNGEYANVFRKTLCELGAHTITKSVHAAFLSLAGNWDEIELKNKVDKSKPLTHVKAPKPDKVVRQDIGKTTQEAKDYYVYLKSKGVAQSYTKNGQKKSKKGTLIEACFIDKTTQEKTYVSSTTEFTFNDYVDSIEKMLSNKNANYTIDVEGDFASAIINFYSGGIVADSTKEKIKKLDNTAITLSSNEEEKALFKLQSLSVIKTKRSVCSKSTQDIIASPIVKPETQELFPIKDAQPELTIKSNTNIQYFIGLVKNQLNNVKQITSSWKRRLKF